MFAFVALAPAICACFWVQEVIILGTGHVHVGAERDAQVRRQVSGDKGSKLQTTVLVLKSLAALNKRVVVLVLSIKRSALLLPQRGKK